MKKLTFTLTSFWISIVSVSAQDVKFEWVDQFSSTGTISSAAITVDDEEYVYMTGMFQDSSVTFQTQSGTERFALHPKRAGYGTDVYVLKVNKEGTVIWARHLGGRGRMEGNAIAVDEQKNVYVTGVYKDSVDFDPGPGEDIRVTTYYEEGAPGSDGHIQDYRDNAYVVKFDGEGTFQWARDFFGKGNNAGGIATTGSGAGIMVYVAGGFLDTIDVNRRSGTDKMITTPDHNDAYIVKLTADGDFVWARQMGRSGWNDYAHAIHVDESGYVFTTGVFSDSADFDPGAGTHLLRSASAPGANVFILKLDADGRYVRAIGMGGTTQGRGSLGASIATDRFGNVAITGYYQVSADFDPLRAGPASQIVGNGNVACFVAAYDSLFRFKWVRPLTSSASGLQQGRGVAVDDAGSVYTTGHFTNDINLNPNNNPPQIVNTPKFNVPNTFISKMDVAGNYVWSKTYPGDFNMGFSIAVSGRRHVYVAGHFFDTVNFNAEGAAEMRIAANSRADAYLLKLACSEQELDTVAVAVCAASYEFNGETYTASGLYEQFFFGDDWCDSVVMLDLTLNEIPDLQITVDGYRLSTVIAYDSYQWFFEGDTIHGATNREYDVSENGKYTVAVTNDAGCAAVSDYYEVTNVGISDLAVQGAGIRVYPNPVKDRLHISGVADMAVFSLDGRLLITADNASVLYAGDLPGGMYLLRLTDPVNGRSLGTVRFVKDHQGK